MTRDELIAALEKATGPSRELDAELHAARFPELRSAPWVSRGGVWVDTSSEDPNMAFPAQYTASIDAALSLVPEGWRWSLDWTQRLPYQDCGRADLYAPGNGIKPADVGDVYAATPAIALCIAALKARTE